MSGAASSTCADLPMRSWCICAARSTCTCPEVSSKWPCPLVVNDSDEECYDFKAKTHRQVVSQATENVVHDYRNLQATRQAAEAAAFRSGNYKNLKKADNIATEQIFCKTTPPMTVLQVHQTIVSTLPDVQPDMASVGRTLDAVDAGKSAGLPVQAAVDACNADHQAALQARHRNREGATGRDPANDRSRSHSPELRKNVDTETEEEDDDEPPMSNPSSLRRTNKEESSSTDGIILDDDEPPKKRRWRTSSPSEPTDAVAFSNGFPTALHSLFANAEQWAEFTREQSDDEDLRGRFVPGSSNITVRSWRGAISPPIHTLPTITGAGIINSQA